MAFVGLKPRKRKASGPAPGSWRGVLGFHHGFRSVQAWVRHVLLNLALVRTLLTYAGESAWLSQAPGAGWQILARSQYDF